MRVSARPSLPLATAAFLCACAGGSQNPTLDVVMVDRAGENAATAIDDGELVVEVSQDGALAACPGATCRTEIRNGMFELGLPIASFNAITRIHAEMTGADMPLVGATPPFQPFGEGLDLGARVQLLMGAPSTCQTLTVEGVLTLRSPRLTQARAQFAPVFRRGLVLLAGGVSGAGPFDGVDVFDGLTSDLAPLQSVNALPLGAAKGVALSEDVSLVVGDRGSYLFESALGPPVPRALALHDGASSRSAVVDRGSDGAAVVGGATREITWLNEVGASEQVTLTTARRLDAAAAAVAGGLLIVGGNDEGTTVVEYVREGSNGEERSTEIPSGRGGWLLPSPTEDAALYIGFTDLDGRASPITFVLRNCREACTIEAGPVWERARIGAGGTITADGALWIVGGERDGVPVAETERVHWVDGSPTLEYGPDLSLARALPVVFEHASGTVIAAGGRGMEGPLDSLDLCLPRALARLVP